MKLYGIDVSNNNGYVDWLQVPQYRRGFIAVKATQGNTFQDGYFNQNWLSLGQLGIPRVAYHYFIPSIPGTEQGEYLHSFVRAHGRFEYGDMVLLDIEEAGNTDSGIIISRAEEFVLYVWKYINKPVAIYSSPGFWSQLGNPISPILSRCPLWIADYGPASPPTLPGWQSPAFWQYSQTGQVPGVNGNCDLDVFLGNKAQLRKIMTVVPKYP